MLCWLRTSLKINDNPLQQVNIFAPNQTSKKATFFKMLYSAVKGCISPVIGRDLNCVQDAYLDKQGGDQQIDRDFSSCPDIWWDIIKKKLRHAFIKLSRERKTCTAKNRIPPHHRNPRASLCGKCSDISLAKKS